jgi:hypothetical protein
VVVVVEAQEVVVAVRAVSVQERHLALHQELLIQLLLALEVRVVQQVQIMELKELLGQTVYLVQ